MVFRSRKALGGMLTVLALGISALAVSPVFSQTVPGPLKTAAKKDLGTFLVDQKGMTLYIFDPDKEAGKSTCYGGCAKVWPPFAPQTDDPAPKAPLSIITRDDGTKQYAYKDVPLYYYEKDTKPGHTTGHGRGKAWWVAKP